MIDAFNKHSPQEKSTEKILQDFYRDAKQNLRYTLSEYKGATVLLVSPSIAGENNKE